MKILLNRKYKLTTLLMTLISISVVLITTILVFVSHQAERNTLIDTHLALNSSKSEKISSSVNSLFKSMRISLQETANFLSEHPEMTDEEIQEQLVLLRNSNRFFNSLVWIDETSLVRSIAPISVGLKGDKVTGITKDVVDLKRPTLTVPYRAPTGRMIVLMSEPIYDANGIYRGIIGGSIYLQEPNILNDILGNDIVDENGSYYYVVGPEGKLLFHPNSDRIGDDVNENPIIERILLGQSGKQFVINSQGVAMYAAYNYIPEIGWGVVQQTPASYIDAALQERTKDLIITILFPIVLLLLISLAFAKKLAEPFIVLANTVNDLGSDKEVQPPIIKSHWNREVDLLSKSVRIAIKTINKNNSELVEAATTDPLTGLANRRKLNEMMSDFEKEGQLFSLVVLDIDHFKLINDTYGHQAGDEVLVDLAVTVQSVIRRQDSLFRYGGEEFVLVMPNIKSSEAYHFAERIRKTIEQRISPVGKSITISLGISESSIHSTCTTDVFSCADKALYESKSNGRNQTTICSLDYSSN
ncbi:sensor domain-containing diguanylate cyclase [Bacillus suaedae]|uniref:Diguanylate cyclase n=1 Tax=Halalkalibacter suaedae TaxID=2822140 RepID=A0A941ANZ8_9BACI|nr:sensor domain-containing diguanylate cyclase [Bacillus suaedae]MBP3950922.1 diguanylate cyclase [Bacillus suaedae]